MNPQTVNAVVRVARSGDLKSSLKRPAHSTPHFSYRMSCEWMREPVTEVSTAHLRRHRQARARHAAFQEFLHPIRKLLEAWIQTMVEYTIEHPFAHVVLAVKQATVFCHDQGLQA